MSRLKLIPLILLSSFFLFAPWVYAAQAPETGTPQSNNSNTTSSNQSTGSGASDKILGACDQAAGSPVCQNSQAAAEDPIVHIINVAATIIATIAGIAAVVMIILGGLNYITAGGSVTGQRAGDSNAVAKAKQQIISAAVGLAVIALAWALTVFVADNVIH